MISVCIATYNGEKYIKEQLGSIISQLSIEDEIVISDNGSTDKTLSIISSLNDSRIKIHHYLMNKGIICNMENALKIARGDYIFLADQDDVWVEGKVQKMLLEFHDGIHIVMSDAIVTDGKLNVLVKRMSNWRKYNPGFARNIVRSRYLGCCMAIDDHIKKQILPFPKGIKAHDVWIGLYGELTNCFKFIDEPLILYRRHDNNVSTASSKSKNSFFTMISYRLYFLFATIYRYKSRIKAEKQTIL